MARLLLKDLTPETAYKIQVRATDGGSTSEWSRLFDLTTEGDTVPPDAPAWISPQNTAWISDGDTFLAQWLPLDLALTQNLDFSHYEVEVSNNAGTNIKSFKTTNTVYVMPFETNRSYFITPEPTVKIRVRSIDANGNASAWTNQLSATNPAPGQPSLPSSGVVAKAATDSIMVSWGAPTEATDNDIVGYTLHVGANAGFSATNTNKIYDGPGTGFTYATTNYTRQYFKIFAVDKFGQKSPAPLTGDEIAVSPFTVDNTPPPVPTSLAGSIVNNVNGIGAIANVSWVMATPTTDLSGYYVRYRKVGDTNWYVAQFDKAATNGTILLQNARTNYEIQAKAFDWAQNESAWTSAVTLTAPASGTPSKPSGVASVAGEDSLRITWTQNTEADLKEYEVTVSASSTFASGNLTFKTGTSAVLEIGGLTATTTYYVRVRAINVAGTVSAWSDTHTKATLTKSMPASGLVGDTLTSTTGKIQLGAGSSIVTNGGAIRSNTYGSDTYDASKTSGFFISDTNIHIPDGNISAKAIKSGSIDSAIITLSGAGAKIVGTGFELSGAGLTVLSGSIAASAFSAVGLNLMPDFYAGFEGSPFEYSNFENPNSLVKFTNAGGGICGITTGDSTSGTQSLGLLGNATDAALIYFGSSDTDYNLPIEVGKSYTFSADIWCRGSVATNATVGIKLSNGVSTDLWTGAIPASQTAATTGIRRSGAFTAPAGVSGGVLFVRINTTTAGAGVNVDSVQFELGVTATPYKRPGTTLIRNGIIETRSLRAPVGSYAQVTRLLPVYDDKGEIVDWSNPVVITDPDKRPAFQIDEYGNAQFSRLSVLGNAIIGDPKTQTIANPVSLQVGTNSASNAITTVVDGSAAIGFVPSDAGRSITGSGIPVGATISSVTSSTQAIMSVNATATATVTATIARTSKVVSTMSSANYVTGASGWSIRSDGSAEFRQLQAESIHGSAMETDTLDANRLSSSSLTADLAILGSLVTPSAGVTVNVSANSGDSFVVNLDHATAPFDESVVGSLVVSDVVPVGTKVSSWSESLPNYLFLSTPVTTTKSSTPAKVVMGRSSSMTGDGFKTVDVDGQANVFLTTDSSKPSTFRGSLFATEIHVQDRFRMFGNNNSLGSNSELVMDAGTYVPTSAPSLSYTWESGFLNTGDGETLYSPAGDAMGVTPTGLVWDEASKKFMYALSFYGANIARFWGPGNFPSDGTRDWGVNVSNAMKNKMDDWPLGGMSIDNNKFYFLTKKMSVNTAAGEWAVQAITRAGAERANGAVAGDHLSYGVWGQNGDMVGNPGFDVYNGAVYIARIAKSTGKLAVYKYASPTSLSTIQFSAPSSQAVTGTITSVNVGKFDFDGTNVYMLVTTSGGTASHRKTYVFRVNASSFTQVAVDFDVPGFKNNVGMAFIGASKDDSNGYFRLVSSDGYFYKHTRFGKLNTNATIGAYQKWRNTESGGSVSAAGPSTPSSTYKRRSIVTVKSQVSIPNTGAGTPNATRFYAGVGTSRFRLADQPEGVTSVSLTEEPLADVPGTEVLMPSGVPSKILFGQGTISGDGKITTLDLVAGVGGVGKINFLNAETINAFPTPIATTFSNNFSVPAGAAGWVRNTAQYHSFTGTISGRAMIISAGYLVSSANTSGVSGYTHFIERWDGSNWVAYWSENLADGVAHNSGRTLRSQSMTILYGLATGATYRAGVAVWRNASSTTSLNSISIKTAGFL